MESEVSAPQGKNTRATNGNSLLEEVQAAYAQLKPVVLHTPLTENINLSSEFDARIFLKREDLQVVRSYKIRGAYNKIASLPAADQQQGVVCASAGNHAQGVAYSCSLLGIKGIIFMPVTTPKQKVKQVEQFGKANVQIVLTGDTFDDAYHEALEFSKKNGQVFIHPFDDRKVIAGQGTVALEILESAKLSFDYLFLPIGGGGLAAGVSSVFRQLSPSTKIIGVEPQGAPSMKTSVEKGVNTTLSNIDKFVDGAAVKRVGDHTFEICRHTLHDILLVPEGKVCTTILRLFNEEAMVVEPAGALAISALEQYRDKIKGKNVLCLVSGSNNDITRTEEIKERSLFYEGLKHYFSVEFAQRPGALKEFVSEVLGPTDDITFFQFSKKNNREKGPAVIGVELQQKKDLQQLLDRMEKFNIKFRYLNENSDLFHLLT